MNAVSLSKVQFSYGATALMQFDFCVEAGERLTIMGASGSGKSTLLHLLAGFETPQSGTIFYDGRNFTAAEPAARPVSILFQENNLFGHLTIHQNVGLGLVPRLSLTKDQHNAVEQAVAKVGLLGFGNRMPSELSGGERQRAALARALLRDKPVLLLDEPFAALGPAMRVDMLDLIMALQSEKAAQNTPLTIIMVTHNPDDAAHFASRIGFVDHDIMIETQPASVLVNPPAHSALALYLGDRR